MLNDLIEKPAEWIENHDIIRDLFTSDTLIIHWYIDPRELEVLELGNQFILAFNINTFI